MSSPWYTAVAPSQLEEAIVDRLGDGPEKEKPHQRQYREHIDNADNAGIMPPEDPPLELAPTCLHGQIVPAAMV